MKWKLCAAILLFSSSVMLTGCRESEVIQNIIFTEDAAEVDDTEVMDPKQREQIDEIAQFKSEQQKDEDKTKPDETDTAAKEAENASAQSKAGTQDGDQTGEDAETAKESAGGDQSDNVEGSEASKTQSGEASSGGNGSAESDDGQDNPSPEPSDPADTPSQEEPNPDDSGKNPAGRIADDPNAREIYDDDGNVIPLPEHVRTVAAPSDAGLIVQMLGGSGTLVASSGDFLSNSLANQVFADEGIGDTAELWSGDGSNGMSDDSFQSLLDMHPDCCILFNGGENLTGTQLEALDEADIPVVLIPKLTTAKKTEEAVRIVGETIGDNSADGGLDSAQLALDYVEYEQGLLKEVAGTNGICSYLGIDYYDVDSRESRNLSNTKGWYSNGGKGTLYIDDWDDSAYIRGIAPYDQVLYQDGIAVVHKDYEYHPMTWYLANAGVVDALSKTYYTGDIYLTPLRDFKGEDINTSNIQYWNFPTRLKNGGNYYYAFESFYIGYTALSGTEWADRENYLGFLGESTYPAVLVKNQKIYQKLYDSQYSTIGLYRPYDALMTADQHEIWGYLTHPEGENSATELRNAQDFRTLIFGNYDIYINPCGVGSWTDGSVEAFLETIWASSKFYGSYSEDSVQSQIRDFYQYFYRHDLSDEQMEDILDGE